VVVTGDASASTLSAGNGGAIAAAIVSAYAVPARSANPRAIRRATEGDSGETNAGESRIAYIQRRINEIVAKLREPEPPP